MTNTPKRNILSLHQRQQMQREADRRVNVGYYVLYNVLHKRMPESLLPPNEIDEILDRLDSK